MVEGLRGSASSLCPRVALRGGKRALMPSDQPTFCPLQPTQASLLGSPGCSGDIGAAPSDGKLELITRVRRVTEAWGKMKMYLIKYSQALKLRGFR